MKKNQLNQNDISKVKELSTKRRERGTLSAALSGGYQAGSRRRAALQNWNPYGGDANSEIAKDLETIIARSHDLIRNSPIASAIISTLSVGTIGTGLSLQLNPDIKYLGWSEAQGEDWTGETISEYKLWAESHNCDASKIHNFYGIQNLAFNTMLESGDCVAITPAIKRIDSPYSLSIQVIEGDRLLNSGRKQDTKTKICGISIDANGAPVSYDICKSHPGSLSTNLEWKTIDAYGKNGRKNVIHIFDRKRPNQLRGLPILTPVIEEIKQLGRYSAAELQAAVVSASMAVFAKMDAEAFSTLFDDQGASEYIQSATAWDGNVDLENPGRITRLLPGESIESPSVGRPNANYSLFFDAAVSQIGVGVGIPKEVMLKLFTSSYSASRAALLDFWRVIRVKRDFMAINFCDPIKELWFEEAVLLGRVKAPGFFNDPRTRQAYLRCSWIGDSPGSINPLDEANAAILRMNAQMTTLEKETIAYDGGDWQANNIQRAKELALRANDGTKEQI